MPDFTSKELGYCFAAKWRKTNNMLSAWVKLEIEHHQFNLKGLADVVLIVSFIKRLLLYGLEEWLNRIVQMLILTRNSIVRPVLFMQQVMKVYNHNSVKMGCNTSITFFEIMFLSPLGIWHKDMAETS